MMLKSAGESLFTFYCKSTQIPQEPSRLFQPEFVSCRSVSRFGKGGILILPPSFSPSPRPSPQATGGRTASCHGGTAWPGQGPAIKTQPAELIYHGVKRNEVVLIGTKATCTGSRRSDCGGRSLPD
jgi:hypothetical protein